MSFIGSMFDPSKGTGFQAQSANIVNPVQAGQTQTAYGQTQDALAKNAAFVNAVNAANGVGNQSTVFNQLQGVANGTGPNPAATQLAQATGNNVAATTAAMAGARGSGANVGLMARQAGQMGAQTQQNAAGQAATLQANQSLGALNQMGGLATSQAGQQANAIAGLNQASQNEQANLLNATAQTNNANVAMQSNMNNANAGIAGINAQGQQQIAGGLMNGAASAAMALAKGGRIPMADGGTVAGPQSAAGKFLSGYNSVTAPQMAGPGAPQSGPQPSMPALQSGGIGMGKALVTGAKALLGGSPAPANTSSGNAPTANDWAAFAGAPGMTQTDANASMMQAGPTMGAAAPLAKGGKVPVMLSPGEKYLTPQQAQAVKQGKANPLTVGKTVPGKAKVQGDSYSNDTVPAKLEKGGLVIPRSILQSDKPMRDAIKFVHAYMAKGGKVGMSKKRK